MTDEVFFVQNAGAKDAGTGLHKSAIIEKISLADAAAVSNKSDAVGLVKVTTVPSSPMVINPNGEQSAILNKHCNDSVLTNNNQQEQPIIGDRSSSPVKVKETTRLLLCGL